MLKRTTFIMIHYFNEGLIPKKFFFFVSLEISIQPHLCFID